MLRRCAWLLGGAGRKRLPTAAAAAAVAVEVPEPPKRTRSPAGKKSKAKSAVSSASTPPPAPPAKRTKGNAGKRTRTSSDAADAEAVSAPTGKGSAAKYAAARPAYMSKEREEEVLHAAQRMQGRDLSGEFPVASFAYEILKAHPSVRDMGLRERMDFLLTRWNKLSDKQRLKYLNDPLKGLL